jgi:hypothetical protein
MNSKELTKNIKKPAEDTLPNRQKEKELYARYMRESRLIGQQKPQQK